MDILKRINFGYDVLIRSITIHKDAVRIEISAKDTTVDKWVNVLFILKGLYEYKIWQPELTSNEVLSDAIQLKMVNGVVWFGLVPYSEDIDNIEDLRKSYIYFICNSFNCKILPYKE